MPNPPKTVPEVFFAVQMLLASFWPEAIEVDKNRKPKTVTWKECLKMMKNPDEFTSKLTSFREIVDANQCIPNNVMAVKSLYLSDPDFTPEILIKRASAAAGVCKWVINIVRYWEVI